MKKARRSTRKARKTPRRAPSRRKTTKSSRRSPSPSRGPADAEGLSRDSAAQIIGLSMLVRVTEDGLKILRVQPASRAPRKERLRRPVLSEEKHSLGSRELLLEFLDDQGATIDNETIAWPGTSRSFVDEGNPVDGEGLLGRPPAKREDVRFLHTHLPRNAAYVHFCRDELVERRGRRRRGSRPSLQKKRRSLALCKLWDRTGGGTGLARMSPLPPPPGPSPLPGIPLEWFPWEKGFGLLTDRLDNVRLLTSDSTGFIAGHETLHQTGDPEDRFDIVILGEGFQEGEMEMFDDRVKVLVEGLKAMEPFKSLYDSHLNVHVVRVVSTDSGVDESPFKPVQKKTFFNVMGDFENKGSPSDFGTEDMARIRDAAAEIAPQNQLDLFIVLINSAIYGGRAYPDARTAFVALHYNDSTFINLAAHEIGHVIANLAEEDIRGVADDSDIEERPNVYYTDASRDQINFPEVPWAAQADKRAGGAWKAVHVHGDPLEIWYDDPPSSSSYPVEPVQADFEPFADEVGLFWGCMYIELRPGETEDSVGYDYFNERGKHYYRPSARCRMRRLSSEFCAVCQKALEDRMTNP